MAARSQAVAADARADSARLPFREIATVIAVVFTATGAMLAGMQWTVSNNLAPLFLAMQRIETQVVSIRDDVAKNRAEIAKNRAAIGELRGLRAEVVENRRQITDLRERMAKVETGLEQVQANQVRMLEILERRPHPRE